MLMPLLVKGLSKTDVQSAVTTVCGVESVARLFSQVRHGARQHALPPSSV